VTPDRECCVEAARGGGLCLSHTSDVPRVTPAMLKRLKARVRYLLRGSRNPTGLWVALDKWADDENRRAVAESDGA